MTTTNALALILFLAGPAAASASPSQPAQATTAPAAQVIGTWNVTFTTPQQVIPAQLVLKKDGEKLVGTVSSQMGSAPVEAQVKANVLDIWFTFQGQSGPMAIEMTGNVDGDTVKGSMVVGGNPGGDWTATRARTDPKDTKDPKDAKDPAASKDQPAASKVDLSGTWNVSVELPNMTATPTLVLKQDGEKLTGEYVSAQYGRFPITGTVKGSDVSFWFAMNVEGNALNVTYTGTVDKDGALSGAVNYGDMMSGTYTASKKK
jgi:hypothetical protein